MPTEEVEFKVEGTDSRVSGLFHHPPGARAMYVLAHGAGAGMRHPFLQSLAELLGNRGVGTLRYQFPYMEEGRRFPNPPALLEATVRSAVRLATRKTPDLPLLAGGKSMGGRMTSRTAARDPLPGVGGLVFLGFPLHAPGKPGVDRADHLVDVPHRMLFLQGTRDALAQRDLIEVVCHRLGARATLHWVEGGDHSFKVLKRSGRSSEEVLGELAEAMDSWVRSLL